MNTYRTPKGTTLPLMNLKGKDYLNVAFRLVWFREEKADWRIQTEFLTLDNDIAIAKATILDPTGSIMATGHKREDRSHFADFMEKAEAGAIGRALAYVGYGTQFCAEEIDEGQRIVDAPQERTPPQAASTDPGDYVIQIGKKYKGAKLKEVGLPELQNFVHWLEDNAAEKGQPISNEARFFKVAVERYQNHLQAAR